MRQRVQAGLAFDADFAAWAERASLNFDSRRRLR